MSKTVYVCLFSKLKDFQFAIYESVYGDKNLHPISKLTIERCNSQFFDDLFIESRKLLHEVYQKEGGWYPKADSPTKFLIEDGQLKDRFDQSCMWISAVDSLNANFKILSTCRVIFGHVNTDGTKVTNDQVSDLDINSYHSSPYKMKKWIEETGPHNVAEIQRNATVKAARGKGLVLTTFYSGLTYLSDQQHRYSYDQNGVLIGASISPSTHKFACLIGGKAVDEWKFKYDLIEDRLYSKISLNNIHASKKHIEKFVTVRSKL